MTRESSILRFHFLSWMQLLSFVHRKAFLIIEGEALNYKSKDLLWKWVLLCSSAIRIIVASLIINIIALELFTIPEMWCFSGLYCKVSSTWKIPSTTKSFRFETDEKKSNFYLARHFIWFNMDIKYSNRKIKK